jgi:hypothetical protein
MYDGPVHPKTLMHMFEELPVPLLEQPQRYAWSLPFYAQPLHQEVSLFMVGNVPE